MLILGRSCKGSRSCLRTQTWTTQRKEEAWNSLKHKPSDYRRRVRHQVGKYEDAIQMWFVQWQHLRHSRIDASLGSCSVDTFALPVKRREARVTCVMTG